MVLAPICSVSIYSRKAAKFPQFLQLKSRDVLQQTTRRPAVFLCFFYTPDTMLYDEKQDIQQKKNSNSTFTQRVFKHVSLHTSHNALVAQETHPLTPIFTTRIDNPFPGLRKLLILTSQLLKYPVHFSCISGYTVCLKGSLQKLQRMKIHQC